MDKYLLTVTVRADGSSKFAKVISGVYFLLLRWHGVCRMRHL